MINIGKAIRMQRLFNRKTGKTIIIPMDHGVSMGPVEGLVEIDKAVEGAAKSRANATIIHKGNVPFGYRGEGDDIGLIVHLSASTGLSTDPYSKALVATVEDAIILGADGVSIHVNIGNGSERKMLEDFGRVSSASNKWQMPLLAMVYARGEGVKQFNVDNVSLSARVACELGADVVKVPYTGDQSSFEKVVKGCSIPVVIAGGEKMDTDKELLEIVKGAIDAGAAGLSIGRNVFQHVKPKAIISAMAAIVHDGESVEFALELLAHLMKDQPKSFWNES